ncbi:MAG: hypothetical protein AAFX99_06415 [Myxococcota bacterium]
MRSVVMCAMWVGGVAALVLYLMACADELEPYNELAGFRVLAIQADRPWSDVQTPTQFQVLVHTPSSEPVEYRWSWCPWPQEGGRTVDCGLDRDRFQGLVVEATGRAWQVPDYDLGSKDSAQLEPPIPADAVTEVCEALLATELPTLLQEPDCDAGMEIAILLTAVHQGESITTFKRLWLQAQTEDEVQQRNPTVVTLVATPAEGGQEAVVLEPEGAVTLAAATAYTLQVEIADEVAETDGDGQREQLTLTWFVVGETEFTRTGFLEGETTLAEAGSNTWTTPTEAGAVPLYVVIRDDRYGVGWLTRTVLIE